MIHGGCWQSAYDLSHVRPLCSAVSNLGLNVWSLEYRRIGNTGGGWPGTFEDILAGVARISREMTGNGKLIIAGHSAGGHLALWAANRLNTTPIDLTIGLAAISDLVSYSKGDSPCEQSTISLIGGTPEEQPRRYAKASPIHLDRGKSTPAITLLHGEQDAIVPLDQSERFAESTGAELISLPSAGHFDMVHPGSVAFPELTRLLEQV